MRLPNALAPLLIASATLAACGEQLPPCPASMSVEQNSHSNPKAVVRAIEYTSHCTPKLLNPGEAAPRTTTADIHEYVNGQKLIQSAPKAHGIDDFAEWLLISIGVIALHTAVGRFAQTKRYRERLFQFRRDRFEYDSDRGEYLPIRPRKAITGEGLVNTVPRIKRVIREGEIYRHSLRMAIMFYPLGCGALVFYYATRRTGGPDLMFGTLAYWLIALPALGYVVGRQLLYVYGDQGIDGALVLDPPRVEVALDDAFGPSVATDAPAALEPDLSYKPTE